MNPSMKNIINRTTMVATFVSLGFLAACSDDVDTASGPKETVKATVLTVASQEVPSYYATSGTVTSDHRVSISSRLSGYIRDMNVREGDKVKANQVLLRIDPVDAKQALIQAEADLADAKADLECYQELLKSGAVSSQQAAKIELRYTVAESQVKQAKNQLSYAEVRSPVAGVVVDKRLSQGDLAAPGAPILTLEDPTSLLVETYVSERFVSNIHEGDTVDIEIPSLNKVYQGVVRQVVQAADPVSHQFLVKTALPFAAEIHPGMYAQTGFRVGKRQAVIVPQTAINSRGGLNSVFVVNAEGVAQYRLVRLGLPQGDQIEILAGLKDGDRIAYQAASALKSGVAVQVSE